MTPLHRTVRTRLGTARVELVDTWIGVTVSGELLERDVWDVTWRAGEVTVTRRVKTFPEPDDVMLHDAVLRTLAQDVRTA